MSLFDESFKKTLEAINFERAKQLGSIIDELNAMQSSSRYAGYGFGNRQNSDIIDMQLHRSDIGRQVRQNRNVIDSYNPWSNMKTTLDK